MDDSRLIAGVAAFLLAFAGAGDLRAQTEPATAPSTQSSDDAFALYQQAAQILSDDNGKNIFSPSASDLTYADYPPMPDAWVRMEKQDYDLHAQVRELVHDAGLLPHANWPAQATLGNNYLNRCRAIANDISDAAVYESLILKNQPAAFALAEDVLQLADLLKNQPGENLIRLLVAEGIESLDYNHLLIIISGATITEDPANKNDLPLETATEWIARLLDHPEAQAELDQALKGELPGTAANPVVTPTLQQVLRSIHHNLTERDFPAMSLAAHVYRYKHGRWPENLQELATELPRLPVDPWGDGKETLGYVLVISGLPDGGDRPLVYSRDNSPDGLFFRTDQPSYSYDHGASGEFRDVASWSPAQGNPPQPTTQPTTRPIPEVIAPAVEFHILADEITSDRVDLMRMNSRLQPGGIGPAPLPGDRIRWVEVQRVEDFDRPGKPRQTRDWHGCHFLPVLVTPDASMDRTSVPTWKIVSAYPAETGNGMRAVGFRLDYSGARRFGELTTRWHKYVSLRHDYSRPRMAIIVQNKIVTAPSLNAPITGGSGLIASGANGGFSEKEMNQLIRDIEADSVRPTSEPSIAATQPITP
jgi:hypothetical protein